MQQFIVTWRTHEGSSSNPARLCREHFTYQQEAVDRINWCVAGGVPHLTNVDTVEVMVDGELVGVAVDDADEPGLHMRG